MDLASSYIDEVDNSLEFELVDDDHEQEEERNEVKVEGEQKQEQSPLRQSVPFDGSPMSYSLLELPDPEDDILTMLTCSSCLGKMDTIVMLVTASGVCEHNFCEDCVSRCRMLAEENDQTFRCPSCNKEVITVCENRQAMELAKRVMEMQANPQHLKDLEQENQSLHEQIQQQQQEHEKLLRNQRQSQAELNHTLTNEREERAVLEKRLEEILRSHDDFKQHSGQMTRKLQQQIQETKMASESQVLSLEKERQNLLQLKEKERESASEAMVELQNKIYRMERSLQSNQALQRSLERSCQRTISELQQRETEVESIREQMKRQTAAQRTRSTPESLIESVSQGMASLLWSSADGIGASIRSSSQGVTLNLLQPIDRYELREIRGDRKEGRVRKAIVKSSGETVALKLVTFDPSVLPDNSVLGTLTRFSWYGKSEEQLEKERVRLSEEEVAAFREAMLLFKLNSESIISLAAIVQTNEPGRFYLQLPYLNFDLHYALETRGSALSEKEARSMMYQILLGVYYLHSGNIVHRSLSASNILTSDMQRVYLTGFSHAISLNSPTPFPPIPGRNLNYVAPELLYMSSEQQSSEAWKAIDMWSVGAIIALLLRRESLFSSTSQKAQCLNSILGVEECLPPESVRTELSTFYFPLKQALLATEGNRVSLRSHFPPNVPDEAVDLVRSLLVFDGAQRLTAADALRHPYFHSVSSSFVPLSCTVGFECTDSDIHSFVEQYCSSVFA